MREFQTFLLNAGYATMLRTGRWSRNISHADLATVHPYNTYRVAGLPPGPIASAGAAALAAALAPAECEDLYFVSRNDGSHYFSKTLREHLRAVEYYQKGARNGFIDTQKK